jgi:hypothetical protein
MGNNRKIPLLRDFNSKIKRRNTNETIGPYENGNINDNGKIDICEYNNCFYKHKNIQKLTCVQTM